LRARGDDLRHAADARGESIRRTRPTCLNQYSVSIGAPLAKDKTFLFATGDYTLQDRTTFLSPTLPSFVLPADGHLDYEGHYRQALAQVASIIASRRRSR
jgi:hypothetical protein